MDRNGEIGYDSKDNASINYIVKSNLSRMLFDSACMFAEKSRTIEDSEKHQEWPQPNYKQNLGLATTAVIMSAAALEAAINETYDLAVDKRYDAFPSLSEAQVDLIALLWDIVDNSQVIKKHDVALVATGKTIIPHGCEPCQSVVALIELRNTIMHYKPEWSDQQNRLKRLEDKLQHKFPSNQLIENVSGHMEWFPARCLGAGCAEWACGAVRNYHVKFTNILGIKNIFGAS